MRDVTMLDVIGSALFCMIIGGLFGYVCYLASTEREREIEHKAKVCEIERQNNMKLDDLCIGETD